MAIYLDREGVEECVRKISSAIEELKTAATDVDGVFMDEIGHCWSGNAYEKCMNTYQDEYQTMLTKSVPDMVDQLNKFVDECKNAIVEVDNQLSGS